jgi:hypothetical protein
MSAAMNAVDAMNYNPSVPVDPDYRCHFTHDWVYEPVEWNGRLYSGASLHVFLEEKRSRTRWIEDPFTRERVSSSTEPTPRPELVARIAVSYQRALEQYEQANLNDNLTTPLSALVPADSNNPITAAPPPPAAAAAAALVALAGVLAAPPGQGRTGRGGGGLVDRRPPIGFNFSNTLEGIHGLKQILLQAKSDGFQNSLAHGKRKKNGFWTILTAGLTDPFRGSYQSKRNCE